MELQKFNPISLPPSLYKTLIVGGDFSGWVGEKEVENQSWFGEIIVHPKAEPYQRELNSLTDFKVEPTAIKDLPTLKIKIENCLVIEVPTQLYEIKEAIDEAAYILTLEEDWDDEGGMPVDKYTFIRAAMFLINYSVWLLENHRIFLSRPQIHPGPNASVDILWRSANYRMLINVPSDVAKDVAFYGDDKKNGKSIKSNVSPEGVEEFLAIWLKNLKH